MPRHSTRARREDANTVFNAACSCKHSLRMSGSSKAQQYSKHVLATWFAKLTEFQVSRVKEWPRSLRMFLRTWLVMWLHSRCQRRRCRAAQMCLGFQCKGHYIFTACAGCIPALHKLGGRLAPRQHGHAIKVASLSERAEISTGLEFAHLSAGDANPLFDRDDDFPLNNSAEALCAKKLAAQGSHGASPLFGGRAGVTRVSYEDLRAATDSFGDHNKIGSGGSSIVYRGMLYGRPCAIKCMSQGEDALVQEQFDAEHDILRNLKHSNICQLFAISVDGPRRCLVLELMDVSLDGRVQEDPALGFEQRVWILLCVCRGLVHLHSRSPPILHCDVKSQNVLLRGFKTHSLDGNSIAKIADFGTARVDNRATGGKLRIPPVGTTPYLPVEYTSLGHIDEKTDAFAFGIILVEMLANFDSLLARSLVNNHEKNCFGISSLYTVTFQKAIKTLAIEASWPMQTAEILSSIAASCTRGARGKMARAAPANILHQLEEVYKVSAEASAGLIEPAMNFASAGA
eukprot:TRINITY_DN91420_c0_g1_i1.p1 TRINITY_DN91420_c0_g1~~TRINITY_DN91420_c0_g1_i1.p1  ORF type:complete len:515 (+),score=77.14 TRINITY_DN91420_c0_g1_i1:57-1601(+)